MIRTRSQLENLSEEELIEELISVEDVSSKLFDLTSRLDDFLRQFKILSLELTVSKNCNHLVREIIFQLERKAFGNAQYQRHESLEINPVPGSIGYDVLEISVCKALSLTSHEVKPDDLQACHHSKKKDIVIVKFKCKKQKVAFLSTERTSIINQMFSPSLNFLVGSLFQRACVMRAINYLINVDS